MFPTFFLSCSYFIFRDIFISDCCQPDLIFRLRTYLFGMEIFAQTSLALALLAIIVIVVRHLILGLYQPEMESNDISVP